VRGARVIAVNIEPQSDFCEHFAADDDEEEEK
jgi:hypothetical protein